MSNEIDVYCNSANLEQLQDVLEKYFNGCFTKFREGMFSYGNDFVALSIERYDDDLWKKELVSVYQVKADFCISIQLKGHESAENEVISLANHLVGQLEGDLILLQNGESTILRRSDSRLQVSLEWSKRPSLKNLEFEYGILS